MAEGEKSLAEKVLSVVGTGDSPGRQPKPLKTNWPYPDCNDTRKQPDPTFFIDDPVTGETVITFKSAGRARDYARKWRLQVRGYVDTLEGIDLENAERRENTRLGLYFVD